MNTNLIVTAYVVGYLTCSVLAFGITNGDFRGEFPTLLNDSSTTHSNCQLGAIEGLVGPLGLGMSYFLSWGAPHGLSYDCNPVKQ